MKRKTICRFATNVPLFTFLISIKILLFVKTNF